MAKSKSNKDAILNARTFDELLTAQYGEPGTSDRDAADARMQAFYIGEMLKTERKAAHMTQAELALKAGTAKSYISKIENGGGEDIQLSTLLRIFGQGLGRRISFVIE